VAIYRCKSQSGNRPKRHQLLHVLPHKKHPEEPD